MDDWAFVSTETWHKPWGMFKAPSERAPEKTEPCSYVFQQDMKFPILARKKNPYRHKGESEWL